MKRGERVTGKLTALMLAVILCFGLCLTGCGGGTSAKTKDDDPLAGNYIPVVGEMMGMALIGDDLKGFGFELQSGGKAVMTVNGETHDVKWTSDDTTITITVDGEEITGERGEDCFAVKDMLGLGMDFTFAKEGTPAADPAQYLPESEKFMLQDWQSVSVTDILGDPTDEIAPDALKMSFRGDHTMDAVIEGKEFKNLKWSNLKDYGSVDSEDVKLTWNIEDDGLKADYVKDGEYYTFFCPKDSSENKVTAEINKESESETESVTEEASEAKTGETKESGDAKSETTVKKVSSEAKSVLGEHGKAAASIYTDYWDRDWFGWYVIESCHGDYEDMEDSIHDVCGSIFVESDNSGRIVLWDDQGSAKSLICEAEVSFGPGTTSAGCMKSEKGYFLLDGENVQHADWIVDPGASDVSDYDHMIEVNCRYEDEHGSFRYYIYLRPWGMDWEDVRTSNVDFLPVSYDYWYTDVKDGSMPESIGKETDVG